MVKHTQTIHWQQSTNCLCVFDHFLWLALKRLKNELVRKLFCSQFSNIVVDNIPLSNHLNSGIIRRREVMTL